ncbi:threonine--tRNA ligase [Buchnera aphidicola]|uniref:Threonine--tRNA ligase n=1 Tax=Buchnera aphidicola (Anoecia oenotherae) TaxID=1241833 RepID=A0A4D6Y487_9GAMM|nr:threonine--tRNA ligase [Buchnera aphidicola]QCI19235.1 threonine--tRNA ligase [Buchnera aphidicola (Anoecia oenotherae)]
MPTIIFFDKKKKIYNNPISIKELIKDYNKKIYHICIAAFINNNIKDLNHLIIEDSTVKFITIYDPESIFIIRNSCLQLLTYAIKKLWIDSKIAEGNITKNGFFCDIELKKFLTKSDIITIENKMKKILKNGYDIKRKKIQVKKAIELFTVIKESYKVKILKNISKKDKKINLYYHESYFDIALSPQVPNIQFCNHFKIQKISGAYWKGNKQNKMLQRISVTAWESNKKLQQFLQKIIFLKKRDHRKINKRLNLYHIQKESPGMVFWHNNGFIIYKELKTFIRLKLKKYFYEEVHTPIIINQSMWEKSGHLDYYKESMFTTSSENRKYCLKPMNCPAHVQIFNRKLVSYKNLPIRLSEFGCCHRNESSGSLHGLLRIRSFTQDDAHIFCSIDQIQSEINNCIKMMFDVYNIFKFKKINVNFSTRPKNRIGNDLIWDQAENDLKSVLNSNNINYHHNIGEGAFYGPKIEFTLQDSLDRLWQCGTIQLDFYLPQRLNANYIDKNNKKKHPVIIHRAILGSIERFIGILLEEYAGKLPTWLSPVQVVLLTVHDKNSKYAYSLEKKLIQLNVRTKCDTRNENISTKIKEHIVCYTPYIIIIGDKEEYSSTITVRTRLGKNIKNICFNNFINALIKEITTYSNTGLEV